MLYSAFEPCIWAVLYDFHVKFLETMVNSRTMQQIKMSFGIKITSVNRIWNLQRKMNPICNKVHCIAEFLIMDVKHGQIRKVLNWTHYGTFRDILQIIGSGQEFK